MTNLSVLNLNRVYHPSNNYNKGHVVREAVVRRGGRWCWIWLRWRILRWSGGWLRLCRGLLCWVGLVFLGQVVFAVRCFCRLDSLDWLSCYCCWYWCSHRLVNCTTESMDSSVLICGLNFWLFHREPASIASYYFYKTHQMPSAAVAVVAMKEPLFAPIELAAERASVF